MSKVFFNTKLTKHTKITRKSGDLFVPLVCLVSLVLKETHKRGPGFAGMSGF